MMEKVIKLVLILMLLEIRSQGQHIQQSKSFYYIPQADTVFITTYLIDNNSENNLYLWFDLDSNKRSSKEYFLNIRGDYSLLELLNEETVTNKRFDIINQTFIKQIRRRGKFFISVLHKSKKDWLSNSFYNKIVFVNEKKLPSSAKSALSRNGEYFYDSEFISIVFDSL